MGRQPNHSRRTVPYTIYHSQALQPEINRRALILAHSILSSGLKAGKLRLVHTASGDSSMFLPRVDIMDDLNSRKTVAVFELPGVRNDELTLSVNGGVMHLNGKRSARSLEEYGIRTKASQDDSTGLKSQTQCKTQELRYGLFRREIALPEGVKEQDVTASLKDGLLIVTWPLAPASLTNAGSDTVPKAEPSAAESA